MPSWVIVGASRGIGYQYLITLSQNPSNTVIGIVRDLETVQAKIKADLATFPTLETVHLLPGDLASSASLTAAAAQASPLLNSAVDYLIINGAYINPETVFINASDYVGRESYLVDEVTKSVTTNAVGALFAINAFLPLVKNGTAKKIVAISSGGGSIDSTLVWATADHVPYCISKAALNMVVAKAAVEHRDAGVLVLAMAPGFVNTISKETEEKMGDVLKPVFEKLTNTLRRLDPDLEGPMAPAESVEVQVKTIEQVGWEWAGKMVGFRGDGRHV